MRQRKNEINAAMTFEEIAAEMGVSHQRVKQLEKRALNKVRVYLLKRFGDTVKMEDILPILDKENIYEQMQSL